MNQKEIGNYTTDNEDDYTCVWYPSQREAIAWGPTSVQGSAAGPRFIVKTKNKEEAKKKLKEAIGPGHF